MVKWIYYIMTSIYQCHCTNNIYSRLQLARLNLGFLLFGILELSPFLFSRFNCSVYKYNHIFNLFYFHFGYISRKCASDVMFALWALLISWLNLAAFQSSFSEILIYFYTKGNSVCAVYLHCYCFYYKNRQTKICHNR